MSARVKIYEEWRAKQGIYLIWCENQTHTGDSFISQLMSVNKEINECRCTAENSNKPEVPQSPDARLS